MVGDQQISGVVLGPLAEETLLARRDQAVQVREGRLLDTTKGSLNLSQETRIKWDFKVILYTFTQVGKLRVYFSESQE